MSSTKDEVLTEIEALKALMDGVKLSPKGCPDSYIFWDASQKVIRAENGYTCNFPLADFLNEDFILYVEPLKPREIWVVYDSKGAVYEAVTSPSASSLDPAWYTVVHFKEALPDDEK